MLLVDARRLTGPNLLARVPLVVAELAFEPGDVPERCLEVVRSELDRIRLAAGFGAPGPERVRFHAGGAAFAFEAPIDVMLAWVELLEWACESASRLSHGGEALSPEARVELARAILARDEHPCLLALAREALRRAVPFLWDDTHVSLGHGCRSMTFAREDVPDPSAVAWDSVGPIPVALITGTNGKTTSSRLLARVATEAGFVVGATSTDGITVAGTTVEEGDWTGPVAARAVLRRKEVELAVLETARGGILRRGLGVDSCDAALITNVTEDHLGAYGIDDLPAMVKTKGVIADAVREGGAVVLNAHDPGLVALAAVLPRRVIFFADLDRGDRAAADVVEAHCGRGGEAAVAVGGQLAYRGAGGAAPIASVSGVPIAFGGAARHNVENALGVCGTALALGIPRDALVRGLCAFDAADNPGRGQFFDKGGVRGILDFGHNPDGVRAVLHLVTRLRQERPGRLTVVTGSAGDRSDSEIDAVAEAIVEARPDRVFVRDLVHYLRGRAPGEVPQAFVRAFARRGLAGEAVAVVDSEVAALERVFADVAEGEMVAVLVHVDRAEVGEFLARQGDG